MRSDLLRLSLGELVGSLIFSARSACWLAMRPALGEVELEHRELSCPSISRSRDAFRAPQLVGIISEIVPRAAGRGGGIRTALSMPPGKDSGPTCGGCLVP